MSAELFCRLCAKKYPPYHLKTAEQLKYEHFDQIIFRYLHINIDESSDFPKMVCLDCCNTIYNFNNFVLNVENAQKLLQEVFLQTATRCMINDGIKSELYDVDDNNSDNETEQQEFKNNDWFPATNDYRSKSDDLKDEPKTFDNFNNGSAELNPEQSTNHKPLNTDKEYKENIDNSSSIFENITDNATDDKHVPTKPTNYKKKTLRNLLWKCYHCLVYYPSVIHLQKHFQNVHNTPVEYNCTECQALFKNLQEFQNHMLYDHDGPLKRRLYAKFKCDLCDFTANYPTTIKNHQYTHTGIKRFACDQCDKRFTFKQNLEKHSITHLRANNNAMLKVNSNGEQSINNQKSKSNKKRRNIQKKSTNTKTVKRIVFKCYKCNNLLQSIKHLERHFNIVHENAELQYMCPKCTKLYSDKQEFENHIKNDHEKKNQCDICGREFNHRTNLIAHYHTHTGIKRYSCDLCGKRFAYKQHAEFHKLKHNRKTYDCDQCSKKCSTEHLLQRHLRTHLPKESKLQHECNVCHKRFASLQGVLGHQKLEHEGGNRYICEICAKSFRFKSQCLTHSKVHTDEKLYNCPQCNKPFKTNTTLRRHLLTHTDIRPHVCETCGSKFREKRMLTLHQKIHSGQLPFQCDTCKKRFVRKYALKVHQRQHTGERPYSCLECNFHFSNCSNYLKHLKVRHGKNSIKESKESSMEQTQINNIVNL